LLLETGADLKEVQARLGDIPSSNRLVMCTPI